MHNDIHLTHTGRMQIALMFASVLGFTMPTPHQYICSLACSFSLYQINLINHNYSLRRTCCPVRYILISSLICVRLCVIQFMLYTFPIPYAFELFIRIYYCISSRLDCIPFEFCCCKRLPDLNPPSMSSCIQRNHA